MSTTILSSIDSRRGGGPGGLHEMHLGIAYVSVDRERLIASNRYMAGSHHDDVSWSCIEWPFIMPAGVRFILTCVNACTDADGRTDPTTMSGHSICNRERKLS
ncbi:hypothetical protein BCAR13_90106 [Paraburkholderia caribensis]|nr:hypothetical protein BCAR13_90106 [Paraburkholderia caribensis]